MKNKLHPSIIKIWQDFINENKNYKQAPMPQSWYFCDNEKDANECAELVVQEIKQATCSSLIWFEKEGEELPSEEMMLVPQKFKTIWVSKS